MFVCSTNALSRCRLSLFEASDVRDRVAQRERIDVSNDRSKMYTRSGRLLNPFWAVRQERAGHIVQIDSITYKQTMSSYRANGNIFHRGDANMVVPRSFADE